MFANIIRPKTTKEIIDSYEKVVKTARLNLINSLESRDETLTYRRNDIEDRINNLQKELYIISREQEWIDNYIEL